MWTVITFAAIVGCLFGGLFQGRRLWAVADTPTIPAGHAFPGIIEVTGTATPAFGRQPFASPVTGELCVWWRVEVQERVKVENDKTEWKTRGTYTSHPVIAVADDSGSILVELPDTGPIGAKDRTIEQGAFPQTLSPSVLAMAAVPGNTAGLGPSVNLRPFGNTWQIKERRVRPGDDIYVHGPSRFEPQLNALLIAKAGNGSLLVYQGKQDSLLVRLRNLTALLFTVFVVGAGLFAGFVVERSEDDNKKFSFAAFAITAAFSLLLLTGIYAVRIRNRIVSAKEQVLASWRLIGIADQQRATLVPQLMAVVTASIKHERELQEALANARAKSETAAGAPNAAHLQASSEAHAAGVGAIAILREQLPTLNTNANFQQVFDQLVHVEGAVAAARGYYADARTVMAHRISVVPDKFFVPLAGPIPAELTVIPNADALLQAPAVR
jgi:LemA protein